jgi:hypothetical protein
MNHADKLSHRRRSVAGNVAVPDTVQQRRPEFGPTAILALQRTVGNQATIQLIQRLTLSASDIKQWIRWVRDPADRANSTRCMLAIYNQMRLSIDPAPAAFRSLAEARRTLIQHNQIDQEDVDALEAEAARLQQAGGDPAEFVRLGIVQKIAAKYAAMDTDYGQHIFQGEFAGTVPTGFHSKADGSATHESYGAATQVGNGGAYQQSVRTRTRPAVRKPIQSTFFPDGATHRQVIEAIASVYAAGLTTVQHVDPNVNGLRLAKRGDTVFPAGGSDQRLAE